MDYSDRFKNVTVLGAGGKMGSGIVLLLSLEMADLSRKPENEEKSFAINAMDVSHDQLKGLIKYLRDQIRRVAEKKIVQLRDIYSERTDLPENWEIIEQYIDDVLEFVHVSTSLNTAAGSTLVFEAVNENPELKIRLYKEIENICDGKTWYFTNTSSIPIYSLEEAGNLGGRIIGFHFYNPPAVQKLVELIPCEKTLKEITEFSLQLAGNLRKTVVTSNDIAGFIGNGHFMREILFAVFELEKYQAEYSFPVALWMINKMTQEFMVRPMGIFQLIDYVGLDVCSYILTVMTQNSKENLQCMLLENLVDQGITGGQFADGSQKDGFLKYTKNRITGIYNLDQKDYFPVEEIEEKVNPILGSLPENHKQWKTVVGSTGKDEHLTSYFKALSEMDTFGSKLTQEYGRNSKEIGLQLVKSGVARSEEDVNTVMATGFYHAYGPINNYYN